MTLKCVRSSLGGSVCCVAVLQGGRPTRVMLPQYLACTLRSRSNGVDATIMTSHHHSKFLPQRAAEMHKAAREQIRPMRYGCQLVTGVWRGYVCTWLSPNARGSYGTPNTLIPYCVFSCMNASCSWRGAGGAPSRLGLGARCAVCTAVQSSTVRNMYVLCTTIQYLCAYTVLYPERLWQHFSQLRFSLK